MSSHDGTPDGNPVQQEGREIPLMGTLQLASFAGNTAAAALTEAMNCATATIANPGAIRAAMESYQRAAATLKSLLPADQQERADH